VARIITAKRLKLKITKKLPRRQKRFGSTFDKKKQFWETKPKSSSVTRADKPTILSDWENPFGNEDLVDCKKLIEELEIACSAIRIEGIGQERETI